VVQPILNFKALEAFSNAAMNLVPDIASADVEWNLCQNKVTTTLQFPAKSKRWLTEKLFCLTIPLLNNQPRSNSIICMIPNQLVANGRGLESSFRLDKNGFEFAHLPPLPKDLDFDDHVAFEIRYLRDMEVFLKEKLDADAVFIIDYTACQCTTSNIQRLTNIAPLLITATGRAHNDRDQIARNKCT